MLIKAIKILLLPTKEQEEIMLKTIGCCRYAYNWALNRCNEMYEQGDGYSMSVVRKEFTQLKKQEDHIWLNEVSNVAMVESMRDLDKAFKHFFNKISGRPRFKSKRTDRKSFYVRNDRLRFREDTCNIEKVGRVKFKSDYTIPKCKYIDPHCTYDGKYWYLSFGLEHDENQVMLHQDSLNSELSIGVDLGVKHLATVNVLDKPIKNINKTKEVKLLKKRLKRLQRQLSRKYEANKEGTKVIKSQNAIKLENKINLVYRRLKNIRLNHIHQTTNSIVKLRPYRVVMEDLNVQGMLKNKHLSKAVKEQCFYTFIRQMKYKCKFNGIEFIQVDRFYPSSKICSCCGEVKTDLKLNDRMYKCSNCGLSIDRDRNASINLANYKLV